MLQNLSIQFLLMMYDQIRELQLLQLGNFKFDLEYFELRKKL